jgi:hypothetical protein
MYTCKAKALVFSCLIDLRQRLNIQFAPTLILLLNATYSAAAAAYSAYPAYLVAEYFAWRTTGPLPMEEGPGLSGSVGLDHEWAIRRVDVFPRHETEPPLENVCNMVDRALV